MLRQMGHNYSEIIQEYHSGLLISQLHRVILKRSKISYSVLLEHLRKTPGLKIQSFAKNSKSLYVSSKLNHNQRKKRLNVMLAEWKLKNFEQGHNMIITIDQAIVQYRIFKQHGIGSRMDDSIEYLTYFRDLRLLKLSGKKYDLVVPNTKPYITLYGFAERDCFCSISINSEGKRVMNFHWFDVTDLITVDRFRREIINVLEWIWVHDVGIDFYFHIYTWNHYACEDYERFLIINENHALSINPVKNSRKHSAFKFYKSTSFHDLDLSRVFSGYRKRINT